MSIIKFYSFEILILCTKSYILRLSGVMVNILLILTHWTLKWQQRENIG